MPRTKAIQNPASFRDPAGFIFHAEKKIFRTVSHSYREHYEHLMESGLYEKLSGTQILVPHKEIPLKKFSHKYKKVYKILEPEKIDFISYPYEWCFSQLKDAALLTLEVQRTAFEHGMTLKDASVYNVQFQNGRAIFIDTLSFEKYIDGTPWVPYGQFCRHFLAPLLLMTHTDVRLIRLLLLYTDGIPLDLASRLLPKRTYLSLSALVHLHIHSKTNSGISAVKKIYRIERNALAVLIDNLHNIVQGLQWKPRGTTWANYASFNNYSSRAVEHKKRIVKEFIKYCNPTSVWDLGANVGIFSRIASSKNIPTYSFDIDPAAVEKNYCAIKKNTPEKLLPLFLDLTNPTPAVGWANEERAALLTRAKPHTILALALIHHLVIANNVPLEKVAAFFANHCQHLIIEFVPKEDSQVQRLLASRADIFRDYTQKTFEKIFSHYFKIKKHESVEESTRTLYWMHRR
ncbi:MAG TPA: hypothetical protein PLY93_10930 [Turneriella sp.]|nr:hypothetical protein [Turneriella sp.]